MVATQQRALAVHLPPTRASDDQHKIRIAVGCCRSKPYTFVPTTYGAVATTKVTFKEGSLDAAFEFLMGLDLTTWVGLVRMRLIKLVSPRMQCLCACLQPVRTSSADSAVPPPRGPSVDTSLRPLSIHCSNAQNRLSRRSLLDMPCLLEQP